MTALIIIVHVIVSIALILIVLLQTGKGAEMGAAFGGSSQTVFGGAGPAPFLGRITTIAAVIFLVTSLSLAYLSANPLGGSIVRDVKPAAQQAEPVPEQDTGNAQPEQASSPSAPAQDTQPAPAQDTAAPAAK